MTSTKKKQVVKMNLTLSREFYQLLQANAKNDYSKTATWTKQFLMKSLNQRNNKEPKCLTSNEKEME